MPRRQAIVELTLTDGSRLSKHVDSVRGTAANPMTRADVVEKCRDLMTPVLGTSICALLIEKILGIDSAKDIRELRPLLQRT
jgi:2-methylcitrate dehydratase PrpD